MDMTNVKEQRKQEEEPINVREQRKLEEAKTEAKTREKTEAKTTEEIIAELKAEKAALKANNTRSLSCKVSTKGAVSVYGLGRFPVTLYKGQWEKLISGIDVVKSFIIEHDSELSIKS